MLAKPPRYMPLAPIGSLRGWFTLLLIVLGLMAAAPASALAQFTLEPSAEEKAAEAKKILMGRDLPEKWAATPENMRGVWKSQILVDAYAAAHGLKKDGSHLIVLRRGMSLEDAGPVREVALGGGLLHPEARQKQGTTNAGTLSMHGLAVNKFVQNVADPDTGEIMGGTVQYVCPKLRIELVCNWTESNFDHESIMQGIVGFGVAKFAEIDQVLDSSQDGTVTITCKMEYYKPLVLQLQTITDASSIHLWGTVFDKKLNQTINYASVEVEYQGVKSGRQLTRDGKYDITLKTAHRGEGRQKQIDLAMTPELYRLQLEWGVLAGDHKGWTRRSYVVPKCVNALRCHGIVYTPAGRPAPGAIVRCKSPKGPRAQVQTNAKGEFELYRTFNSKGFMGMTLPMEKFRVLSEDPAAPPFETAGMSKEDLQWAMKLADARQEILKSYKDQINQESFKKLAGIYKGINIYDVLTSESPDPREYAKLKKIIQEDLKGKELEIGLKLLTEPAKRVFGNVSTVDKYWNETKKFFGVKTKKTPQVNNVSNNLKKALSRIAEFKAIEKEI